MRGALVISLDFELHWGGFEKWPIESYKTYFLNTRQAIPQMLAHFERYNIHVTWATVGLLFNRNRDEMKLNQPEQLPGYVDTKLSAYEYIRQHGIGNDEINDPFHFAPSLIEQIIKTPHQELASHTYSHFYCNEPGQSVSQFESDLKSAQKVAAKFDKTLQSLVFPRNQFNDDYLQACYRNGIVSVRSNPPDWFWKIDTAVEPRVKRLVRGVDAYVPVGNRKSFSLSRLTVKPGYPVCIPASRLLRPYNPKEFFLNRLKIERVKSEMADAARKGEVYHLWWHPHNFGGHPGQSMEGLKMILENYAYCRDRWGMSSLSMGELAFRLMNREVDTAA